MKTNLKIQNAKIIHDLPDIWSPAQLIEVIDKTEIEGFADTAEEDLLDLTLMALDEIGHQKAGEAVLEVVFGKDMSPGQRQNLVDDLQDEEPWQDFSVVGQQRGIFIAVVLMHQAFPNRYPNPDARELSISGLTEPATISNAQLVRSLGTAMSPNDVLRRLYEEELQKGEFADADHIIWYRNTDPEGNLTLISSVQWLGSLRKGDEFPLA